MGSSYKVIGQTGSIILSDEKEHFKLSKGRTVRYRYVKMKGQCGYRAEVVGPFHSALYGACSFGTKRTSAKAALIRRLATDYNYIGKLLFSDVDESDTVGIVNPRLLDPSMSNAPITNNQLVGSAGR